MVESFKDINRICIIGGSGTGKTTLANNISKELNIPVLHIDGVHHLPNWEVRDKNERDKIILDKVKEHKWIIDGTYKSTLEARVQNADKVIFLDYSMPARMKGVVGRCIKNRGKEVQDIPGCVESLNMFLVKLVLKFKKEKRPGIIEEINKVDKDKVLIFKNRKALNKWFEMEFNKKMEL